MAQQKKKTDVGKIALYAIGGYLVFRFAAKLFRGVTGPQDSTVTTPEALNCTSIWNSGQLSRTQGAYYNDADEIYNAIQGSTFIVSPWEDDTKIAAVLMRAGNQADVEALICAFGNRKTSILSPAQPLGAWISSYLDSGKVKEVNDYYAYKGISYRW